MRPYPGPRRLASASRSRTSADPTAHGPGRRRSSPTCTPDSQTVILDFATPEGRGELDPASPSSAGIVIESSRPRALRRLGLVAEDWLAAAPGRVWVSVTGYGRERPAAAGSLRRRRRGGRRPGRARARTARRSSAATPSPTRSAACTPAWPRWPRTPTAAAGSSMSRWPGYAPTSPGRTSAPGAGGTGSASAARTWDVRHGEPPSGSPIP